MKIGFSGTRHGMTVVQVRAAWSVLVALAPCMELHHGDCVGGDEQMHRLFNRKGKRIVIHPPIDAKFRAWCDAGGHLAWIRTEVQAPYLTRNRAIVDACTVLLAGPRETFGESLRSGTWATVRYARSTAKPLVIVRPDGFARVENVGHIEPLSELLAPWMFPTLKPSTGGFSTVAMRKMACRLRADKGLFVQQAARIFGVSKDGYSALEDGSLGLAEDGWAALYRTLENWPVVGSAP